MEKEQNEKALDEVYQYAVDVDSDEDASFPIWTVDWHIMPWLCGIYLLNFLDKSLLNYSAAMGIKKHLKGNQFGDLSTICYGAYIAGEPLMSYIMQKWSILKSLGVFVALWGVVVACHAACHTYAQLMVVRTLLGLLELCTAIGLMQISSMWYPIKEQTARMGLWACQAGTATIIGALLSFGFQHIHLPILELWQILFLVMGCITTVFGIGVFFFLPDNVSNALWLTPAQKLAVILAIKKNQTGTKCTEIKKDQVMELLIYDPTTWLIFFTILISQIVTGAIGAFSVTVTMSFGFDNYESALLQIPVGVLITISCFALTYMVRFWGYLVVIIQMLIPGVVGGIVLLCKVLKYGHLFGLYLLYVGLCSITMFYAWPSANTLGSTKKFGRSILTMVAFLLASIIGPQMFQGTDTEYRPAKIVILVTQAVSIPLVMAIAGVYWQQNKKKLKETTGEYLFLDMTDGKNPEFVYKL